MSHVSLTLGVNGKPTQQIAVFPYKVNTLGKITEPGALRSAIINGESYATLVYLCGGTRPLYRMMHQHFGGTLLTLRKRWGVKLERRG